MASTTRSIDPAFTELPVHRLADAALSRARDFHVSHADFRLERIRSQTLRLRDAVLQGSDDRQDLGFGVRVIVDGTWGFAASVKLTVEEAVRVTEQAVSVANLAALINHEPIELATEPPHPDATWVSSYDVDPFTVATAEKVEQLAEWSRQLLAGERVAHVAASLEQVMENKFYADTAGTTTTQQRVRIAPVLEAHGLDKDSGHIDSMRTLAPPAGRGWEYLTGTGWDWSDELAQIPELLAAKLAAPSVEPGAHDLVIHPSNLFLTIHESIGHATELDRALGYEANYAGTSFATFDQLGSLRYGSEAMHVTGDRTIEHGLATIGFDDEGVAGQAWDIVKDGILVGYQLDRRMARSQGLGRSNGCAFADSPLHIPIQRMANVSLQPAPEGASTGDLISQVERGIYIVGDKSWSIDMQRYNFQFTGQRFFRIENGHLGGQLRDVAYQATTTDFWGSMEAVGGPQTWVLGGTFGCGKAQPGQVAPVSHGCPAALFRGVRILNTTTESGR
jgi:TldD protein